MNKDQVKGEAKDIAGKVQEEAGKVRRELPNRLALRKKMR